MKKTSIGGSLMLALTALIWGCAFVAQSVAMDYVGPFTFNGIRSVIGGIFLLPCIAFLDKLAGRGRDKSRELWKGTVIKGGILCGIALFVASNLQQFGIMYTTVGKSGFITALYIVFVPLIGIAFKRRPTLFVWIGVLLAVVGMYLLCMTEGFFLSTGDLLVLLCAVCFSVHILVIEKFSPLVDGVRMSCIQFLTCGALSLICAAFTETIVIKDVLSAWVPLLYAGILSCGVAYTLQVVAQKNVPSSLAALIMSLESVFAVLAGWIILKENLSTREVIGCVLVFAAIILAQLPSKKQQKIAQ